MDIRHRPIRQGRPKGTAQGRISPGGVKPVIDQIKPQDVAAFHGKLDAAKMNPFEKWIIKRVKAEFGDFRDWDMINKWAKGIAAAVKG
jgi:hypothetical protein